MSGGNIWEEEPNFSITDFDQTVNYGETHSETKSSMSLLEDDFEFSKLNFTLSGNKLVNPVNYISSNDQKHISAIEKESNKNYVVLDDFTSAETATTSGLDKFNPLKLNIKDELKNTEYSFSKLLGGNEPKSRDFIRKFVEGRFACYIERAKQKYSKSCTNLIELNDSQHLLVNYGQDDYDGNRSKSCEDLNATFDKNCSPFVSVDEILNKEDNQCAPLNSTFVKAGDCAPLNSTFSKDDEQFAPLNFTFSKDDNASVPLNTTFDKDKNDLELHSTFNKVTEACDNQRLEIQFSNTFNKSSHFSKSIEVLNIYDNEKKKESSETAPNRNDTYEIKGSSHMNGSHIMKKSFSCSGLTQLSSNTDKKGHSGKNNSLLDIEMKFEDSIPSEDEKDEYGLPVLKKFDLSFYESSREPQKQDDELTHIVQKYNIMRTSFCEPNNDDDDDKDVRNEEQLHTKTEVFTVKEPIVPIMHGGETPPKHVDRNMPRAKGPMKVLPPLQNMAKHLTDKFMSPFTKNKAKGPLAPKVMNTSHALYESFDESVQIPIAASTPSSSGAGHASRRESGGVNRRRSLSSGAAPRFSYEPVQEPSTNLSSVPAADAVKNSTFTSKKLLISSGANQLKQPVKGNMGLKRPSSAPSQPSLKPPITKMLPAKSQINIPSNLMKRNSSVCANNSTRNSTLNPIRNVAAPRSSLISKTSGIGGRHSTLPKTAANSTLSKTSVPLKPSAQINTTASTLNTGLKRSSMLPSKLRSLTGFGKENKK